MKKLFLILTSILTIPSVAVAAWTPIIVQTDFDGLRTDLLTAVAGIVTLILIVAGIGILVRVLTRN